MENKNSLLPILIGIVCLFWISISKEHELKPEPTEKAISGFPVRYVIISNKDSSVSRNFSMKEFYSKCKGFQASHKLDSRLIPAIQLIRDNYGPIVITSSYRDHMCNKAANGAPKSLHMAHKAIDFKFVGKNSRSLSKLYASHILNKSYIYQKLLSIGVKGYGVYPSAVFHIDTRHSNVTQWDSWNRTKKLFSELIFGKITETKRVSKANGLIHECQ